jgi:hypothetical protein
MALTDASPELAIVDVVALRVEGTATAVVARCGCVRANSNWV